MLGVTNERALEGTIMRMIEFEPTSNKWQGEICRGFQMHVSDTDRFKPYRASLSLLQAILHCHAGQFDWKAPPYEYEHKKMPIDLILGSQQIRTQLSDMKPVTALESDWQSELDAFDDLRKAYLLYA